MANPGCWVNGSTSYTWWISIRRLSFVLSDAVSSLFVQTWLVEYFTGSREIWLKSAIIDLYIEIQELLAMTDRIWWINNTASHMVKPIVPLLSTRSIWLHCAQWADISMMEGAPSDKMKKHTQLRSGQWLENMHFGTWIDELGRYCFRASLKKPSPLKRRIRSRSG